MELKSKKLNKMEKGEEMELKSKKLNKSKKEDYRLGKRRF